MKLPSGVVITALNPTELGGLCACVLPVRARIARAPPNTHVATILFICARVSCEASYATTEYSIVLSQVYPCSCMHMRAGTDFGGPYVRLTGNLLAVYKLGAEQRVNDGRA